MVWLFNILIILLTIAGMELLSWAMHKYLFHGPLWFIHKTHHEQRNGWFELNDVFSILFAGLSLWLMWEGHFEQDYRLFIGIGISIYGTIYFIFHDWFIHNRFKPFKTNNRYLLNIRRAHKMHHKSTEKWPSEEFGLLVASKKYLKK
ncbi:sterol desaturase family protein [Mucilaginibacter sp. RS28]|uniref:Sterol desaturase family protein n=1 Tax=Mucilaginibacter straminoryzae TaxID=2932774 RepID=A0A9X1X673_9SPHI|nr:sterol desaturase family protein [Mucilaginibacter straminoryzae]MCJ8209374.1 sterol desaturase family protein [Mucilaginibacter straminoryzae]